MFPLGIALAVSVRIAQAAGAGEWARVRPIGLGGMGISVVLMGLFAGVYLCLGGPLVSVFVGDAATAAVGVQLLAVAGVFQVFDGMQVVSISALRGLSDVRVPTVIAFVSYWVVALPACYLLGRAKPPGRGGDLVGSRVGAGVRRPGAFRAVRGKNRRPTPGRPFAGTRPGVCCRPHFRRAMTSPSPAGLPELLAPAGNWECARAAVENGADAIYFGLSRFNARMRADNFTEADLPALMEFLHRRGVRGYVTFNTLVFADELPAAEAYLRAIIAAGVDAAIVQDIGICRLIRRLSPDFPIHGSTQMTVTSAAGAEFVRDLGCQLVVLARECSIKEIAEIRATLDARQTPRSRWKCSSTARSAWRIPASA